MVWGDKLDGKDTLKIIVFYNQYRS